MKLVRVVKSDALDMKKVKRGDAYQRPGEKYGLQYSEIGNNDRIASKEKWFKTKEARKKFIDQLRDKGRLHQVIAYYNEDSADRKVARKSDDGTDFTDVANQLRKMLTSGRLVRAIAESIYYENSAKLKRLLDEFLSSGNRLTKELLAYR